MRVFIRASVSPREPVKPVHLKHLLFNSLAMKTFVVLSVAAVCLAEADPCYMIHTAIPSVDPNKWQPPNGGDEVLKQLFTLDPS